MTNSPGSLSVGIRRDGSLWAWGLLDFDEIFSDSDLDFARHADAPARVAEGNDWTAVSCGWRHVVALRQDGSLWARGSNFAGQLGVGDREPREEFVRVGSDTDWTSISASQHTLPLKRDGSLWAWGFGGFNQLGTGKPHTQTNEPEAVDDAKDWASASACRGHSLALKRDGSLWFWGAENSWEPRWLESEGDGFESAFHYFPFQVGGSRQWIAAWAGWNQSFALDRGGSLWTWSHDDDRFEYGYGEFERLCEGESGGAWPLIRVARGPWADLSSGGECGAGVRRNGSLWGWESRPGATRIRPSRVRPETAD